MQVLCLYGLRIWQMQNLCVTVQFLLCFILNLRTISESRGACIWRGNLSDVFLRYEFGGPIFRAIHTWSGLFSEFHGIPYM